MTQLSSRSSLSYAQPSGWSSRSMASRARAPDGTWVKAKARARISVPAARGLLRKTIDHVVLTPRPEDNKIGWEINVRLGHVCAEIAVLHRRRDHWDWCPVRGRVRAA
jgi:hypothetical protein